MTEIAEKALNWPTSVVFIASFIFCRWSAVSENKISFSILKDLYFDGAGNVLDTDLNQKFVVSCFWFALHRLYHALQTMFYFLTIRNFDCTWFLVMCTRPKKPFCWSVGPSVAVYEEHATYGNWPCLPYIVRDFNTNLHKAFLPTNWPPFYGILTFWLSFVRITALPGQERDREI